MLQNTNALADDDDGEKDTLLTAAACTYNQVYLSGYRAMPFYLEKCHSTTFIPKQKSIHLQRFFA